MVKKSITINSAILFVVAAVTEMTLHEFGHFFAAILVHAQQISIHHNYVSTLEEGLPLAKNLFIKAAGPLVSIMIGILFHRVCSRQTKRNLLFLFNLYMSGFGYIGFFGYLLIAPMFTGGDTGYIFDAIGLPGWLTIIIALTGAVLLYFLIVSLTTYFVEMASKEVMENKEDRKVFVRSLILYPLLIGIVITTLLNLPAPAILSLIAPICSPLSFMWGYGSALRKNYSTNNANKDFKDLNKLHISLFVLLALTIIGNRFLVSGIYFN
jgi:hypothetical protein